MAPPRRRRRRRNRVLVALFARKVGHLIFRLNVKRLFSGNDDERRWPREVLTFPRCPVGRIGDLACQDMVVSNPDCTEILAATDDRIYVCDTANKKSFFSAGPNMRAAKCQPLVVALDGGREMLVTAHRALNYSPCPRFEAFRRGRGRRWHALPPVPPPPSHHAALEVEAYFLLGRIWYMSDVEGTYSYDTARGVWCTEGTWRLPFKRRGLYVPDLGLVFGFTRSDHHGSLLACDVRARPPVIRNEWRFLDHLLPTKREGYRRNVSFLFAHLVYLGAGRFCISWSSNYNSRDPLHHGLFALTAFEVTARAGTGELHLRKRKSCCYNMTSDHIVASLVTGS